MNQGSQALSSMLAPFDPTATQDYWKQAFVNPAMQNYQQTILPGIAEKYAGQNATSSGAFNRALAESGTNLSTGLNAQLANLLYQGRESQLGRQQTGINQAAQYAGLPAQLAGGISDLASQGINVGQQQRAIGQEGLSSEYNKWLSSQPYQNPYMSFLGPALGTSAFENIAYQKPDMLSSLMPMLGQVGGAGLSSWLGGFGAGK